MISSVVLPSASAWKVRIRRWRSIRGLCGIGAFSKRIDGRVHEIIRCPIRQTRIRIGENRQVCGNRRVRSAAYGRPFDIIAAGAQRGIPVENRPSVTGGSGRASDCGGYRLACAVDIEFGDSPPVCRCAAGLCDSKITGGQSRKWIVVTGGSAPDGYSVADAAASITLAISVGLEMKLTWLAFNSFVFAFMRFAMNRSKSGLMALS